MTTAPVATESGKRMSQRASPGLVTWLVLRGAAIALLVLVPLKVYSGWVVVGAAPGGAFLAGLHTNARIDVLLIAAVSFHALFGIRTMLVEFGWAQPTRVLFAVTTAVAFALTAVGLYFSL